MGDKKTNNNKEFMMSPVIKLSVHIWTTSEDEN